MKKKLPPAKTPLPKFRSDKEAAEYFETHSVADVWDQLPKSKPVNPAAALAETIRVRHARAKSPISIRLVPQQIAAGQKNAPAQSARYPTPSALSACCGQ